MADLAVREGRGIGADDVDLGGDRHQLGDRRPHPPRRTVLAPVQRRLDLGVVASEASREIPW
jgi:hypothetical protein